MKIPIIYWEKKCGKNQTNCPVHVEVLVGACCCEWAAIGLMYLQQWFLLGVSTVPMFELKSSLCLCCYRRKCRQLIGCWAQVQSSHWSGLQPITGRLRSSEGSEGGKGGRNSSGLLGSTEPFSCSVLAGCLNAVRPLDHRLLASFPPAKHPRPPRSCPAATKT